MKKLKPEILRKEFHPNFKRLPWTPSWNCYCCKDTGFIQDWLVELVMPGFEPGRHKRPLCQNCDSDKIGASLTPSLDYRFDRETCEDLDRTAREEWTRTLAEWQKQRECGETETQPVDITALASQMSLRKCDRTSEEEELAQRKHEEVLAKFS